MSLSKPVWIVISLQCIAIYLYTKAQHKPTNNESAFIITEPHSQRFYNKRNTKLEVYYMDLVPVPLQPGKRRGVIASRPGLHYRGPSKFWTCLCQPIYVVIGYSNARMRPTMFGKFTVIISHSYLGILLTYRYMLTQTELEPTHTSRYSCVNELFFPFVVQSQRLCSAACLL